MIKAQLLLMTSWMLILLAQNSVATANANRTKCSDDDNNVKQKIQKLYCTAIKIYDDIVTVRKLSYHGYIMFFVNANA